VADQDNSLPAPLPQGPTRSAAAREVLLLASDEELLRHVEIEHTRTGGPGGQHRNKVESGVRMKHPPTGITVTATERRSQHQNKAEAVGRMRAALALGVRSPAVEHDELPADLAAQLGLLHWHRISPNNPLFWRLAARILDRLVADQARLSDTARALGVSTGSLSKFLSDDPALWQAANRLRAAFGHGPLRTNG
jgi:hypothetical protein